MNYAPYARIFVRYIVGLVIGMDAADTLAGDPDIVTIVAAAIGFGVEALYALAKQKGWAT